MLKFGKIFEGQMLLTTYMESEGMTIYDYKRTDKACFALLPWIDDSFMQ